MGEKLAITQKLVKGNGREKSCRREGPPHEATHWAWRQAVCLCAATREDLIITTSGSEGMPVFTSANKDNSIYEEPMGGPTRNWVP